MQRCFFLFLSASFLASCARLDAPISPSVRVEATGETVVAAGVPVVAGCKIFPANNPWNADISKYPLDPRSSQYIAQLSGDLHPDFGTNPHWGFPINIVPSTQKKVPVRFHYDKQSDPGPYPIPPDAQIEGGRNSNGDRHVLVLQRGSCKLYEMFHAYPIDRGKSWRAISGAIFRLDSNKLRPNGWTSADAAGLPIIPALVKCAEVRAGVINHALQVTFDRTQEGYIHPATHFASDSRAKDLPPMGLRFRLEASYDISKITGQARVIAVAMKRYGMFVAQNGSNWYFAGEGGSKSSCWNNDDLDQLKSVPNAAFEVVETGRILHKSGP